MNLHHVKISTRKDTTEEVRTKIKRKRPVCTAKSGKRKLFPLSLPEGRDSGNPK